MEKITIIIPIYNVEKYLNACMKSIIIQTYRNIEIIMVDDGSTDWSAKICDKYKELDNRIIVLHQQNMGLSAARNNGLKAATGIYITFIDSDDYIAPDYIEKLYDALKTTNTDIALCDLKKVSENQELEDMDYKIDKFDNNVILSNCQAIEEVYKPSYHGVDFIAVAKLYKRELFESNKVEFPVGRIHEDAFTTYKLLYAAKKIVYIDIPMYFYRIRNGSITTSSFSLKRLDKIIATKEECDFFLKEQQYLLLEYALYDHLHEMKNILSNLIESNQQFEIEKKKIAKQIKDDISYYGQYVKIPIKKKMYYRLLSAFPIKLLSDL